MKDASIHRSGSFFTKFPAAIILGCIAGILFEMVWPYLPIGSWSRNEQFPSKALRFVAHDGNELFDGGVYLETVDGIIYRCEDFDLPCVPSNESAPSGLSRDCGSPMGITPWAPGTVTDKLSYRFCGVDGFADRYYVILDDGSVWQWTSRGWSAIANDFCISFWMLFGGIVGAVVWLVFHGITRKRHSSSQTRA